MPTIGDKVRFLGDPAHYPHRPGRVEVVETHMSWVFLAGSLVFKLKKPVRSPVLDFSSLAARELNCRNELRLNRRLAPQVYLAVVPLTRAADRRLALDGPGELLRLYRAARALLRARLALAHLREPDPRTPEKWQPLALDYVAIAEAALADRSRPAARQASHS